MSKTIEIHAEQVVDADITTVWRALEAPRWSWSSFMLGLDPRITGQDGTLRLRGLPGGVPIRVRLLAVEAERELRWAGGIRGLFFGEHYIRLRPDGGATRVEHGELYTGLVGAFVVGMFRDAITRVYDRDIAGLAAAVSKA
jgi:hypothetical protein